MAFTISNPFYMNRRKRRGSATKSKAAKRRQRDAKGRFLSKSRSRSKSRRRALTTGKRRAAQRKGRMTAASLQALARRYGYVAKVHKRKPRTLSKERSALMRAAKAAYRERYGSKAAAQSIFAQAPESRAALKAAEMMAALNAADEASPIAIPDWVPGSAMEATGRRSAGGSSTTRTTAMTAEEKEALKARLARKNRKHRRNSRTRRNGLYERGLNVLAQAPYGLGRVAVLAAEVASAVGLHLLAAKGINAVADTNSDLAAFRNRVAPVGFTLTGLAVRQGLVPTLDLAYKTPVVGGFLKAAQETLISEASINEVANLAFVVGVALDAYRYFKGTSSTFGAIEGGGLVYGDGTAYEIVPYTAQYGPMANANVMYGAIEGGLVYGAVEGGGLFYGDADLADASHCGADLSGAELNAARSGMHAYLTKFPTNGTTTATRVAGRASSNAGREGYRWGWLIKLVGWEKFQQIAALPTAQRCRVIAQLRLQAMQSLQSIINGSEMVLPDHSSPVNSSPTMAGLDYSGLSYNGFVYAGV